MGFGKGIADFEGISAPLITLGFGLLLWFGTGAAWFLEQTIYAGHPPSFFGVVVDLATVAIILAAAATGVAGLLGWRAGGIRRPLSVVALFPVVLIVVYTWIAIQDVLYPTLVAEEGAAAVVPRLAVGEETRGAVGPRSGGLATTNAPWTVVTLWQGPDDSPSDDAVVSRMGFDEGTVSLLETDYIGLIGVAGHDGRTFGVTGFVEGEPIDGRAAVWVCDKTRRAFTLAVAIDHSPEAARIVRAEPWGYSGPSNVLKQAVELVECHGHGEVPYPSIHADVPARWRRDKSKDGDAGGWYSRNYDQQVFAALVREPHIAAEDCRERARLEIRETTGFVPAGLEVEATSDKCTATGTASGLVVRFDSRPCPDFPDVSLFTLGTADPALDPAERVDPTGFLSCCKDE